MKRLVAWILLLLLAAPYGAGGENGVRPQLSPVPAPNLRSVDEVVRREMEAARDRTGELLGRPETPLTDLAEAFGGLGRLYLVYNLVEAAEIAFDNARRLDPEEFRWVYYLGSIYQESRRLAEARQALERALELRGDDVPTLLRLGRVEYSMDRLDRAEEIFRQALALDPAAAAARYGLGRIALSRRDYELAGEHFVATLKAQPEASQAHYQLGLTYRELGDLERARDHLTRRGRAEVSFPDPMFDGLGARRAGPSLYLISGNQARARGELREAIAAFRKALEADPNHLAARQALASALTEIGDVDEAIAEYREILKLDSRNAPALYNLGTALAKVGRVEEAVGYLKRAVEAGPENPDAWVNLAAALESQGRLAEAEAAYAEAWALSPDPELAFRRVDLLGRLGRGGEAVGMLRALLGGEALADRPRAKGRLHLALANALGREGEYGQAARHFREALRLEPDDGSAWFGGGMALILSGAHAEARHHLEEGIAALPENLALRHLLARLLAASPEDGVRDGRKALELAMEVFRVRQSLDHAETVAMAHAELGRFSEAVEWQSRIVERARATGQLERIPILVGRKALYERGEPCRSPWLVNESS